MLKKQKSMTSEPTQKLSYIKNAPKPSDLIKKEDDDEICKHLQKLLQSKNQSDIVAANLLIQNKYYEVRILQAFFSTF